MSTEYELITSTGKRSVLGEIIVTLFEFCDMNCKFCNQDHASVVGMDNIRQKLHDIKDSISQLESIGKNTFEVHIMGGEVFSDFVPDSCFDDYRYLYEELTSWRDNIEVSFTTNFVWKNTKRVEDLLRDCPDLLLMSSYDPSGRFSKENHQIFMENVKAFSNSGRLKSFNVIMTKPNMRKIMSKEDPSFDYIYDNFPIYFDYYTPEKNAIMMSPNDIELREFMKFMVDVYPECGPFNKFLDKSSVNRMSCMDTHTIMPTGKSGYCTILLDGDSDNYIPKKEMEESWFKDYNCLVCPHYKRCTFGCFLSNHLSSFRTQEECWLSEVYDYVDEKCGAMPD